MDLFSISELSGFAGVKPHTIRAWEQRYGALQPRRSEGNTRYYDSHQLRRLLNIVSLSGKEFSIAQLCSMSDKKLADLVAETGKKKKSGKVSEYFVSQLLAAGMNYDEEGLEKFYSETVSRFGMLNAYTRVMLPLLERIGLMWAAGKLPPCKEHFISHFLRKKMFAAIDALPQPASKARTWLLFLREDEYHDIGLLFAHYLVRQEGHRVVYLGSSVPLQSLAEAIIAVKPHNVLFFLVHRDDPEETNSYFENLDKITVGKKVFVCAGSDLAGRHKLPRRFRLFESPVALQEELREQQRS